MTNTLTGATKTATYIVVFDDPQANYSLFLNSFGEWVKGLDNAIEFAVRKEAVAKADEAPFPRDLVHVKRIVRRII